VGDPHDDLEALRGELLSLESALAQRRVADLPGGYEAVLHPEFHETGASGRWWSRAQTMVALEAAAPDDIALERFEVAVISPGVVLATYDTAGARPARRASIWVRDGRQWRIRFHQGTPR
jgi:ribonuclease HI